MSQFILNLFRELIKVQLVPNCPLNPATKMKVADATPTLSDACQKAMKGVMDKLVQRITSMIVTEK